MLVEQQCDHASFVKSEHRFRIDSKGLRPRMRRGLRSDDLLLRRGFGLQAQSDLNQSPEAQETQKAMRSNSLLRGVPNPWPRARRATEGMREFAWWKSMLAGIARPSIPIHPFIPERRSPPARVLPIVSAWTGIESILGDILTRFGIGTEKCLEFGVELGYSTAAFSSFFDSVSGVDTFQGDKHAPLGRDFYGETVANLASYANIRLFKCDYRDWIAQDQSSYDLIHVDIIHTYADTFACGLWSARHASCALFHDTESYPAVRRAVLDIARLSGKRFYNFKESNGLGILV